MLTKRNMKVLVLLILYNFLPIISFGGTIDPYVDDQKYLIYAKDFTYVGRLEGKYEDESMFSASAVAIDDFNILTAAHVIHNIRQNTCSVTFNGKKFCITNFNKPKEFDIKKFGHYDIAIGHASQSFDLKFYPTLYTDKDEVGKVCCMAGYGQTGTFISGAIVMDFKLRAGSNVIDGTFKDLLMCSPSTHNSSTRTSLEFLISTGDSGGGLFIGEKLAGINSCILTNDKEANSSYDDASGHTRISEFLDWINKNRTK